MNFQSLQPRLLLPLLVLILHSQVMPEAMLNFAYLHTLKMNCTRFNESAKTFSKLLILILNQASRASILLLPRTEEISEIF